MSPRRSLLLALALIVLQSASPSGQQVAPWSGIAADEARMSNGEQHYGNSSVSPGALSADARYIAFSSNSPLLPSDTNGDYVADVYLRDRVTGELTLISVANDGSQGNSQSGDATISADGRHVAFTSFATNLVDGDTNGQTDLFVRDTQLGTTVRLSLGPNGEQPFVTLQQGYRLSADGRYAVFVAVYDSPTGFPRAFLRDRDPDANGVFDEPGLSTITQIFEPIVGSGELYYTYDASISRDGQSIAYTAATIDNNQDIGLRLYLFDRATSTTVRVDTPAPGYGESWGYATTPEFSEAGHLAYATGANDLVEGDTDNTYDVFVYDLATGVNTQVQLTHANAPTLFGAYTPALSADGRYVTFVGEEYIPEPDALWLYNVYAVDRQLNQSYEISVRPDGTRDDNTYGAAAISADGSAIAFAATMDMLANGGISRGVFVATTVALSPAEDADVPAEGGTYSVELTAPAHTSWTLEYGPTVMVSPSSGVGSATIEITIPASAEDVINSVVVGSERVIFRQISPVTVSQVSPQAGTLSGGMNVDIYGSGFSAEATVSFGGAEATNVVLIDPGHLQATTPAHAYGWVTVVVTKPIGGSGQLENGFYYWDESPPVVTHTVTGTLGLNDWYTSDVLVEWTVDDPESPVTLDWCEPFSMTFDSTGDNAICVAHSEGGYAYEEVFIQRDATPPVAVVTQPEARTYFQGEQAALNYSCDDATSGVMDCTASQAGPNLDTSTVGTFDFTVTATDYAGNPATSTVTYTVKTVTATTAAPASGVYNGFVTLQATLMAGATPLAGKTLLFFIDDVSAGAATTSASGAAEEIESLKGLDAGTHTLRVEFGGDETTLPSTGTAVLEIAKATPIVTWADPAGITYGTALSGTQLNAVANVSGTFEYAPAAGAVLNAGTRSLSVTFTPANANYNTVTADVSIVVAKATPVITWADPAGITYGTALSGTQLNATTEVAGVFAYLPGPGTVLDAGTQTLTVLFQPVDGANYNDVADEVSIVVGQATPVITWGDPASITYGTALGSTQLNATANVPGTFAYSPASGTVLAAGTHPLTVTFTPTDATNYTGAASNASIQVSAAALTIQTDNAAKVYGEALPAFTATGTGFVNGDTLASLSGTLSFSTPATATSAPGNYSVTPSGASSPNYAIAFAAGTLTVNQAATAVVLTTTPNPSNNNQNVQMQAVVSAVAPGAGTPTGTVTFHDSGELLGTAPLVNGVATLTKRFKRGTHPLTATYAGAADFSGSAGASTHVVN